MHGVEWGKIQRLPQRITYHYCQAPFRVELRSMRIFGSCWRRSCGSLFPTRSSPAPIPVHGRMQANSERGMNFLWHGAAWTHSIGALRSVENAFFSLLTSLGYLHRSFYLMFLARRKTARRRSFKCITATQTGR